MKVLAASLLLLACAFGAQTTSAQQDPGRSAVNAQSSDDYFPEPYYVATPDQLIRQGVDRLAGFMMGSPNTDEQSAREFVGVEIAPYFDFEYMARWAAGPFYHRLNAHHRAAMTAKLKELFLNALARNLGALQRPLPRIDVFPARPGQTMSEARVYARVLAERGPPLRLEFRFYWSAQGWKVYDAVANGSSAVAFFRGYFSAALRRHGPDVLLQ
jgi:phospholipid transport system substrate-binding protein